jgi:hypothetical protein
MMELPRELQLMVFEHLEVVKWLHEIRTERSTTRAMEIAAEKGYLDVVKFLHENRTEGCGTWAMDEQRLPLKDIFGKTL